MRRTTDFMFHATTALNEEFRPPIMVRNCMPALPLRQEIAGHNEQQMRRLWTSPRSKEALITTDIEIEQSPVASMRVFYLCFSFPNPSEECCFVQRLHQATSP